MGSDFTKSTIVKSHYSNDVIFGRGSGVSSWPGNVAFRHTVWKYRQLYTMARRRDKREIGRTVTQEMKSLNGRFLIINPKTGNYHEVSTKRAEDKACQSLREKDVKMPVGFDLQAMKNRKRWFRSIITNQPIVQPLDCISNSTNTHVDDRESRASRHISKKCRLPVQPDAKRSRKTSIHSSAKASNNIDHKASSSGKLNQHFLLDDEDPIGYNEIIHDDDMSVMTLDHMVHPTIPFQGESLMSNQSVDGFGDDNSVLVDFKTWPEREDPAF
jgi:hypothetical protein